MEMIRKILESWANPKKVLRKVGMRCENAEAELCQAQVNLGLAKLAVTPLSVSAKNGRLSLFSSTVTELTKRKGKQQKKIRSYLGLRGWSG